jgi:hypothetical protein
MAPISKRRKLSDLKASGDTNELLNKIEKFISLLDEGREDLPDGLIDKLQELRDKLENVRLDNAELFRADQPLLSTLPSRRWIQ